MNISTHPRGDVVPYVENLVNFLNPDWQSITITKLDLFGDSYAIGVTSSESAGKHVRASKRYTNILQPTTQGG
jgi:hypothetical protein